MKRKRITSLVTETEIESFQEKAIEGGATFGVFAHNIISAEINHPSDFISSMNEDGTVLSGFPVFYKNEDGNLVLESCYGFGKEDKIICSSIFCEEQ